MSSLRQKGIRHANKQEKYDPHTHPGKAGNRNRPSEGPNVRLSRTDIRAAIINRFKELKESMLKKLKVQFCNFTRQGTPPNMPMHSW